MYCTDDLDTMPARVKARAIEYSGKKLADYRKLTVSQGRPALHDWCNRGTVRELWKQLPDGTLVNIRPDPEYARRMARGIVPCRW